IAIALGEQLSLREAGVSPRGHAIECRIYAEDPLQGFAPSPGRVSALRLPQGPGVRNDVGIEAGSVVPIDYDPMLGKLIRQASARRRGRLIGQGSSRANALGRLPRALSEYEISGVVTPLPLFAALTAAPDFRAGAFDVQWLARWLAGGRLAAPSGARPEIVSL